MAYLSTKQNPVRLILFLSSNSCSPSKKRPSSCNYSGNGPKIVKETGLSWRSIYFFHDDDDDDEDVDVDVDDKTRFHKTK